MELSPTGSTASSSGVTLFVGLACRISLSLELVD